VFTTPSLVNQTISGSGTILQILYKNVLGSTTLQFSNYGIMPQTITGGQSSSGTFAVVLIIGSLLLLLISICLRQKKKDEAGSRPQNCEFCELHSAQGLELPERVDGWLDLSGLTTVEGVKLPNHGGGG
jgi:hypothetical protein